MNYIYYIMSKKKKQATLQAAFDSKASGIAVALFQNSPPIIHFHIPLIIEKSCPQWTAFFCVMGFYIK